MDFIWSLPDVAISLMLCTRTFASPACVAFALVRCVTSSIEAVTCSIALACSVEPCARAWLAFATCSEPTVIWALASFTLLSVILFSESSLTIALPSTSLSLRGFASIVRSPFEIASVISVCTLIASDICANSSSSSPRSSLYTFLQSTSISPIVIFLAASDSFAIGTVIALIRSAQYRMVIRIATTITTTCRMVRAISCVFSSKSLSSDVVSIISIRIRRLSSTSSATNLLFVTSSLIASSVLPSLTRLISSAEDSYQLSILLRTRRY